MSLQATPRADRVHIAVFGLRNSGKSSLVNALTGQNTAIVSHVAGTTTDPVYKSMEIAGLGPCVFIDTAGFDDIGGIGELRMQRTRRILDKTDIAILVLDGSFYENLSSQTEISKRIRPLLSDEEIHWLTALKEKRIPVVGVLNKTDLFKKTDVIADTIASVISESSGIPVVPVSTITGHGIEGLKEQLIRSLPEFESLLH
jgi:small GTP-binding protein